MVASARRFEFRFDPRYRRAALPFGVTPRRAWVAVGSELLEAHYGPWRVRTPLTNIEHAEITGPYRFYRTAGPARYGVIDHSLTFASNGERGVCISFHEPITGLDPLGALRHPTLTLTVAEPEQLAALLDPAGVSAAPLG